MGCRILLTGFCGTSAERLIVPSYDHDILLLPSDKQKDGELLVGELNSGKYDFVICIGQRPNIKDKIHIETTARDGDKLIKTNVDCESLVQLFAKHEIPAKVSDNAGVSYCNALYYKGLQFVTENHMKTKLIFIHIPFRRNIGDIISFKKYFFEVLDELSVKGDTDVWIK